MRAPHRILRRKLLRDLWRERAQALAIALVVACAVATVVMAANTRHSLAHSLDEYYVQADFADLFATVSLGPEGLRPILEGIPGVRAVETRITAWAMLTVPYATEPAVARVISLPDGREPTVNRIVLQSGRRVAAGNTREAVVSAPFAQAHGLAPGDHLRVHLGGMPRELTIVGLAHSPEAVFAIGPGQIVPDDRRFGFLWMSRSALAEAVGLPDSFNEVVLRLHSPQFAATVRAELDSLLSDHGGTAAFGREVHASHAYVQGQLDQLAGLALLLPPMFLLVAAALLHAAMRRMLVLERRQLGILQSLGIEPPVVRRHYLQRAAVIVLAGAAPGTALGHWLGIELTSLYSELFHLAVLQRSTDSMALAAALMSVLLVAWFSVALTMRRVTRLTPAEVLRPAPAPMYRAGWRLPGLGEKGRMLVRQLWRHRERATLTGTATALAVGLVVATAFSFDALAHMLRVTAASERQDATVLTPFPVPGAVLERLQALPGVRLAEGFRLVQAELQSGEKRVPVPLVGLPEDGELRQLLGPGLEPLAPPRHGLALTARLAASLGVRPGELLRLRLPHAATEITVPVAALSEQYFGVEAAVALPVLNDWLGEAERYNGARVAFDAAAREDFLAALQDVPALAGYIDQTATLEAFHDTMTRTLRILVSFFLLFAVLTTVGVLYGNARMLYAERRHDLAILRALGFPAQAVVRLLLAELLLPVLVALPFGLALGRLFGWLVVLGLDSPLFQVPLVIAPRTDVFAVLLTLVASSAAALLIARAAIRLPLAQALAAGE